MTISRPQTPDLTALSLTNEGVDPKFIFPSPGSYTRRDLYEERQTLENGVGAFATKKITAGTRLFCEESILMLPDEAEHVELYDAVKGLEKEKEEVFWSLAASTKPSKDVGWTDKLREKCDEDISESFNDLVERHELAWSIYETNRFTCKPLHMPPDGDKSLGIFPQSARVNHSCAPNVFHRYNPAINRLTIHALRDIEVGEELLTSYIDICHPTVTRRHLLKHWGFRCRCSACDSPDDEEDYRRKRIEDLFAKMQSIEKRRLKNEDKWTAKDYDKGLAVVERCIRLLEREGMEETDTLGVAYAAGVRLAVKVTGKEETAVEWAEKAVEIEKKCLGEDSAEFVAARELLDMAIRVNAEAGGANSPTIDTSKLPSTL